MDTDIRNLLEKDGQIYELEEMVAGKGFKTMFDNGRRKVLDGTTTVEELRRTLGTRKY
jgi:type II secretory ATPase GspE/PulE/Tfp pilus assembly ATPase PilB-like protein